MAGLAWGMAAASTTCLSAGTPFGMRVEIADDGLGILGQRGADGAGQPGKRLELDRRAGQAPGGDRATVDQRERSKEAARDDPPSVRSENRLARAPAQEQWVERSEQPRRGQFGGRRASREVDEAVLLFDEL